MCGNPATTMTEAEMTYTEVSGCNLLQLGTLGVQSWIDGGISSLTVQSDTIVFLQNHLHTPITSVVHILHNITMKTRRYIC